MPPELAMDLPTGAGTPDATQAFKAKVEESKLKIQAEMPTYDPPRGKWRPGGRGRKPKWAKEGPIVDITPRPQVAQPSTPPPDLAPYLVAPLQGLSRIPAAQVGIPELALNSEEAMACAQSLNLLLQAFAPNLGTMSPKTAAILSAGSTFGMIAIAKYQIYVEKMAARAPKPEPAPQPEAPFPTEMAELHPLHASDYFKKQH